MFETNPFSLLSEVVPTVVMQVFIIAMVLLIAFGTIIQMINHKNLTYFFNNAKKAKLQATREVGAAEKAKICLLYTSPSPRDLSTSRMPSSA